MRPPFAIAMVIEDPWEGHRADRREASKASYLAIPQYAYGPVTLVSSSIIIKTGLPFGIGRSSLPRPVSRFL
jgi:hypothetical protein